MSERFYIRFGPIPKDERSKVFCHGIEVGHEIGVSAYHGVEIDGVWHVVFPNPSNCNTIDTLQAFVGGPGPGSPSSDVVYVITGDQVGTGCDGEPLLRNIRIIKNITGQFVYNGNDDRAYEMSQEIDPATGKTMYDLGFDKYLRKQEGLKHA